MGLSRCLSVVCCCSLDVAGSDIGSSLWIVVLCKLSSLPMNLQRKRNLVDLL